MRGRLANELHQKPLDRQLLDRLAAEVGTAGQICDMGCGPGHVARYLRDSGASVFGLDVSPKMLEEARRLNPDIPFRLGDMLGLDLPTGALGGIAAFYSIVNIPEPSLPAVFSEMQRVLRPGGLLLAFHADREVVREERLWDIPISMDFYHFDPVAIRGCLENAGFTIADVIERGPYAPEVEYQSHRAYIFARKPEPRVALLVATNILKRLSKKTTNMSKLRVHSFGVSLDGYGAGPNQSLENPLGVGGPALHEWVFKTRTFQAMWGKDGGTTGIDDDFAARGFADIGAWIIGRNMFGPLRGRWPDDTWKGWWGEEPPYHTPVFVLTHHARPALIMSGGTTFHFVTDGIHNALARAREAAEGKDIRLGGGVATIRQYLLAGLIDEMHLAYAPALLGCGECLLGEIDLPALGYDLKTHATTANVLHVTIAKKSSRCAIAAIS